MDHKQIEEQVLSLLKTITQLQGEIVSLQAKHLAVISVLSVHISPDSPESILKLLEVFAEKSRSQLDVAAPLRKELLELMSALDLVKKHGGGTHKA
jgi:hypothetical protein